MKLGMGILALTGAMLLVSCAKKDSGSAANSAGGGPHAVVHLKDGSAVPGSIVASSQTDMTVAGDDGIERKIPMIQVQSVDYGAGAPASQSASAPPPMAGPPPPPAAITTRTYELPSGSQISVRTNEAIDSGTAAEGQTFGAQVTRNAKDANGDVVIPRGAAARIVIKSASKGGRFRGASDLVLDLQSVTVGGKTYAIRAADIAEKGHSGVGANKRTAEFGGGGAALGAIIGAVAGGGKAAAIGAGAGGGAGLLTEVITKGGAIKVPAESVLTFGLDKPLRVTAE
jgi:hypothetical protein